MSHADTRTADVRVIGQLHSSQSPTCAAAVVAWRCLYPSACLTECPLLAAQMLAGKKPAVYQAVCQAGGLPHLVSLARRRRSLPPVDTADAADEAKLGSSEANDCCALELVAGMASHKRTHKQLKAAGGVKLLVEALSWGGFLEAQKHAAWAVQCLAGVPSTGLAPGSSRAGSQKTSGSLLPAVNAVCALATP